MLKTDEHATNNLPHFIFRAFVIAIDHVKNHQEHKEILDIFFVSNPAFADSLQSKKILNDCMTESIAYADPFARTPLHIKESPQFKRPKQKPFNDNHPNVEITVPPEIEEYLKSENPVIDDNTGVFVELLGNTIDGVVKWVLSGLVRWALNRNHSF